MAGCSATQSARARRHAEGVHGDLLWRTSERHRQAAVRRAGASCVYAPQLAAVGHRHQGAWGHAKPGCGMRVCKAGQLELLAPDLWAHRAARPGPCSIACRPAWQLRISLRLRARPVWEGAGAGGCRSRRAVDAQAQHDACCQRVDPVRGPSAALPFHGAAGPPCSGYV